MTDPLTRALALIRVDPKQRAAYAFGFEEGFMIGADTYREDGRTTSQRKAGDAAAAYLLLAETPPEPAKAWTVTEAEALILTASRAIQKLDEQRQWVAVHAADLSFRDLDPTGRAATEGALGVACAKLAALVGGARG